MKTPVFVYDSVCCNVPAKKEPCVRSEADKKEKKFSASTLGSWRCNKCAKKCKVTRRKNLTIPE